jgi:hypothetical protein
VSVVGVRVASVDDVRRDEEAGATGLVVTPFTNPREGAGAVARSGDEMASRL